MQKLVIASHNSGKIREIGELLAPFGLQVVSAAEAGVDEPEETGLTFAENAALKARNAAQKTGLRALADDSGLVIPALGGAPGIYSARWAVGKDFIPAFTRIERELAAENISAASGVAAYFVCALCLAYPACHSESSEESLQNNDKFLPQQQVRGQDDIVIFEGRIDGTLSFPPRGELGFGYDPIFIPQGYEISFAEMEAVEKHKISHRARAFAALSGFLEKISENI